MHPSGNMVQSRSQSAFSHSRSQSGDAIDIEGGSMSSKSSGAQREFTAHPNATHARIARAIAKDPQRFAQIAVIVLVVCFLLALRAS